MPPPTKAGADPIVELLAADGRDYRGLYYLWEKQQWSAVEIDLAPDADAWAEVDPIVTRAISDATSWSHLRASHAVTSLVPFVDAAPTEEQQVFLTTQLVDEARHLVFFDRYRREVLGHESEDMAAGVPSSGAAGASSTLVGELPELARRLRGGDPDVFIEALAAYQVAILGVHDLTRATFLLDVLHERDLLAAWCEGMELASRDHHRHVAFALRAIHEDGSGTSAARRGLDRVMPPVTGDLDAAAAAAPLPGAEGLSDLGRAALDRWLVAVELGGP